MRIFFIFLFSFMIFLSCGSSGNSDSNSCRKGYPSDCPNDYFCNFTNSETAEDGTVTGVCEYKMDCISNEGCSTGYYCYNSRYCLPEGTEPDTPLPDLDNAEPDEDASSTDTDEISDDTPDTVITDQDTTTPDTICGDGNKEGNEECDDGNNTSGDGCDAECKKEPAKCGNNLVEDGETCDGNTELCSSIAGSLWEEGNATCLSDCSGFDTSACLAAYSENDPPDENFADSNRDGIDGEIEKAVFVDSVSGDDSNAGTIDSPFATIQAGIEKVFSDETKFYVLIAAGEYNEIIIFKDSVEIYGGYSGYPDWKRSVNNIVTVKGSTTPVIFENLTKGFISRVNIEASDAEEPGTSSYGVIIKNSTNIKIHNSQISAGKGANGTNGSNGNAGASGSSGGSGNKGCEDSGALCSSCSRPAGGTGGSSSCGRTGGTGGTPGNGSSNGNSGGAGLYSTAGGSGGTWDNSASCKALSSLGSYPANGRNGASGVSGSAGNGGLGFGSFDDNGYIPANGANGSEGDNGNGGGGGGGGRGGDDYCDSYGSSGGGGGGGGCGGTGGYGGTGAGGSFAVWINSSTGVALHNDIITTNNGGVGGNGGSGGSGGSGGAGGAQGSYGGDDEQGEGGCGGYGGSGGNGGNGGNGGGGGGGPSIGIFKHLSEVSYSSSTFTIGDGGKGGTSSSINGSDGAKLDVYEK